MGSMKNFIERLPKVELHLHIEGSLEPDLLFELAKRNGVELTYKSVEELKRAYNFSNLQTFLDIYYQGAQVLLKEQDFYDLTSAYLERMDAENVRHVEIFFDPQTHTDRGVPFATVIEGIKRALDDAEQRHGITNHLIMCYLRHLSEDAAEKTWLEAKPYWHWLKAVGLDSSELGHPPEKFSRVFAKARDQGLLTVAHAGEEGPPEYIWQALDDLKVSRIDHGVRCLEDGNLVKRLADERIPLTVCPLSNVKLRVFDTLADHNLKVLLENDLMATINSDDPAYFGGYMVQNYMETQQALGLTLDEVVQIARNGVQAAFLTDARRQELLSEINQVAEEFAHLR